MNNVTYPDYAFGLFCVLFAGEVAYALTFYVRRAILRRGETK